MFDTYLQEGDVVYLKSGTLVAVPSVRSILGDENLSPFCPFISTICVKVGKEYHSRTDVSKERDRIRDMVKQAFADDHIPLDESILDRFLKHQIKDQDKVSLYIHPTRYVVIDVKFEGKRRIVYCREYYNESGRTVFFYQGPSSVTGPLVHNWIRRE
jgi:hypothetical protein